MESSGWQQEAAVAARPAAAAKKTRVVPKKAAPTKHRAGPSNKLIEIIAARRKAGATSAPAQDGPSSTLMQIIAAKRIAATEQDDKSEEVQAEAQKRLSLLVPTDQPAEIQVCITCRVRVSACSV